MDIKASENILLIVKAITLRLFVAKEYLKAYSKQRIDSESEICISEPSKRVVIQKYVFSNVVFIFNDILHHIGTGNLKPISRYS